MWWTWLGITARVEMSDIQKLTTYEIYLPDFPLSKITIELREWLDPDPEKPRRAWAWRSSHGVKTPRMAKPLFFTDDDAVHDLAIDSMLPVVEVLERLATAMSTQIDNAVARGQKPDASWLVEVEPAQTDGSQIN